MKPRVLSKTATLQLVARALFQANARRDLASALRNDLDRLARLARAWAQGRYRSVPWRTLSMATGALLYFVNPLDAVPDFLVGVGYLDDATVLAMVAASLRGDLDRFSAWERDAEITTD